MARNCDFATLAASAASFAWSNERFAESTSRPCRIARVVVSLTSRAARTMVIAIRAEPPTLAQKVLGSGVGTSYATTQRLFNATLSILDERGTAQPYLAETLPRLNTDSWRLFPDGRMETTFRLKPNVIWQDGTPLSAEDFVFAREVYASPQVGISNASPQNLIAEVTAPDARTLVIHWSRSYPAAGTLAEADFPPLPRAILEAQFHQDPAALVKHSYFTLDYVGLGPYRVTQWLPGAHIEAVAFDAHILGKPKIDRIRVMFISDTNTALASVLADEVQFATDSVIRFEQGLTLRREWAASRAGTVLVKTGSYRGAWFQLRPEVASPAAVLDLRVRRALAHAISRPDVNDALFEGQGIMTELPFISPAAAYIAEVDRASVKYPFDLRASEQLMGEAGFRKGPDGTYAGVTFEIRTLSDTQREKEMAVLADGWRKAGFPFTESTLRSTQAADNEARATFPSLFTYSTSSGEYSLTGFVSTAIGSADNRWIGTNRGGWVNRDFDRVAASFADAIEPNERVRHVAEMARIMTEDLPNIPLLFDSATDAHVAAVRGPRVGVPDSLISWDIQDWTMDLRVPSPLVGEG